MIRRVGGTQHNYRPTYGHRLDYHRNYARARSGGAGPISGGIGGIRAFFAAVFSFITILAAIIVHFMDKLFPGRAESRRAVKHKGKHAVQSEAPAPAAAEGFPFFHKQASRELIADEPATFRGALVNRAGARREPFTVIDGGFALRTGLVVLAILLIITTGVLISSINIMASANTVTLDDGINPITVSSRAATVGQLMDEYGIYLGEGDIVYPARTSELQEDTRIQIRRAMSIDVLADGTLKTLRIQAGTVRDALAVEGIAVGEEDIVTPSLNTKLAPGMSIGITRVKTETLTQTERIHFREIVQEDKTLMLGTRETSQKGKEGSKELEIEVVYHNGEEISRDIIGERIVDAPVHRIVKEGTKTAAPKPAATAKPKASPAKAAEGKKAPSKKTQITKYAVVTDGKRYDIKDTDHFTVTAYTHTGRKTSTGTWPKVGTIAVDPDVIPYGTYLYIDGYGIGRAADTGVSGKHIDLFFETYEECIQYGRKRNVKVYILNRPTAAD